MFLNTYFFTGLVQYCYGQSWLRPKGSRTTSSEGSTNSVANASKCRSVAHDNSHNSGSNPGSRNSSQSSSPTKMLEPVRPTPKAQPYRTFNGVYCTIL